MTAPTGPAVGPSASAAPSSIRQLRHLAGRFVSSLRPGPPAPADEAWAVAALGPGERVLWARMSNPDRRHAVGVAREVDRRWPERVGATSAPTPPVEVTAAALLHDVGKIDAALRTPARVLATVVWAVLDDDVARRWAESRPGTGRRRLGRYRRHPEIGADLLHRAGAAPLVVAWAAQHHQPEDRWTVPVEVGRLLKDCDDD